MVTDMMLSVFSSRYCRDARVGEESWFLVPMCFSHQAPAAKVASLRLGSPRVQGARGGAVLTRPLHRPCLWPLRSQASQAEGTGTHVAAFPAPHPTCVSPTRAESQARSRKSRKGWDPCLFPHASWQLGLQSTKRPCRCSSTTGWQWLSPPPRVLASWSRTSHTHAPCSRCPSGA